jgi:hypothetical protein
MGGGESENEGGGRRMIMTCIIGVGTTWHKDLFDNSIVDPPKPGEWRPMGIRVSARRTQRGHLVRGLPTDTSSELRSVANLNRKKVEPGEKETVLARYLELIEVNPCNKQVIVQIGQEMNRPYQTVDNWIREAGVKRGAHVGITDEKRGRILELREGGMSIWNIAREVRSSTHTVKNVIEKQREGGAYGQQP